MKQLIICEKPSLAKNVCNGLGLNGEDFNRKNNYYESENYIVTYVFGHLFSMYDIDDYTGESSSWKLEQLPFVPDEFKYKLKLENKTKKTDTGVQKQYELIKSLVHSDSVASIANCGDSDREGQIIIDIVLQQANNHKPVYRLWLPEQTEETIASEIKNMKPNSEYDNLAQEGYARQYVDWLYGINFTRYATIKSQTLLRVGRVITPIVKIIYDREKEIENFTPVPYYQVQSNELTNGVETELIVKQKWNSDTDEELVKTLNDLRANQSIVSSISKKEKTKTSPKLFSQSDLQNFLSKKYKIKPSDTLNLTQSLYEKGYVTYPRTPTNYLSTNEADKVKKIIFKMQTDKNEKIVFKDTKRIFDDSKIESHSAIIPTTKIPDLNALSEFEKKCYLAIYNRFCSVFCEEEYKIAETTITVQNGIYLFDLVGSVMLTPGFTKYDDSTIPKNQKELPNVEEGEVINSNFKTTQKFTNPPKYWTVESLNNFLKNPFRKDSDTEDEIYNNLLKGLEIGTEATRPGIIDNALYSEYITLNKGSYRIAEKGIFLIESIEKLEIDISVESTANLGADLKSVYKKEKEQEELVKETKEELQRVIDKDITIATHVRQVESLGSCPICSKEVVENKAVYTCVNKDCRFVIYKEHNFITRGGKKLTKTMVKSLLKNKKVNVKGLTSNKTGKKYDCECILDIGEKYINIKPNFK